MVRKKSELGAAIKACKTAFIGAAVFSFFINLLMLVSPLYMLQIYDRVLASQSVTTLVVISIIVLFLFIIFGILEALRSRVLIRVGARLDASMNSRVFSSIFRMSVRHPGASSSQAMRDMDTVREFLTGNGPAAFFDAPWLPIFLAFVYLIHPWLGVLSTIGAVILFCLALATELATRKTLGEASGESIVSSRFVDHGLRNADAIEAMGMVPAIMQRWKLRRKRMIQLQAQASDRATTIAAISKGTRFALQSGILGLGAYLAILHEITPGMMIAASIIMGRALAPVELAVGTWKQLLAARTSYSRLDQLLQTVPADQETMDLPAPKGDLKVEQVVAAPPGSKVPSLKGVSFTVAAGSIIGIIGPSAAGKSSLAKVVVGIWPAFSGVVRLDGADISKWDRDRLGPYIGYLPQDIELFEGTIAENIARFGEVESDKVIRAAQSSGVHDLILQLPEGYDTRIGPGGQALSGGQRQRIGLARAIYDDPPLIILDEPNSNLDKEGEEALGTTLAQLKERNCTTLVITHRPSILSSVEYVMVMKAGLIEKLGPRDEVLAQYTRPTAVPANSSL